MLAAACLAAAAAPAAADPATFVQARLAAEGGASEAASRGFAALLRADPRSRLVAARALDHGIAAGDWPLALAAARRLDQQGQLPPLRRLLLVADAFKRRDWPAAGRQIDRVEQERVLATAVPVLRAWRSFGMGEGDPLAPLAAMASGPVAGYGVEHGALIALARGGADVAHFAALDPASGLRPQRLRIAAAAELAARGRRAEALALVAGDQPALAAARRLIEAGRPVPGRIDSAADGAAELLARLAIDLNQQEAGEEAAMLAQLAAFLAPDNSQAAILGAEILGEERAAAAVRLLERVDPGDPFARTARDLRLRLLARSGQAERALAELRGRLARGSSDPGDWIQLGDLLSRANRHAEAAWAFDRAIAAWRAGSFPAIPEWALHLSRGGALERAGSWPEGRAALREAYRLAPSEPLVLNYLGYAQLDRGENLDESERLVRAAHGLAPDNAAITDSLGWALYRRGRVAEAIPYLERAARGEPADVEINDHLGDAYYAAGRRNEARFAWRASLVYAEGEQAERLRAKIDRGPGIAAAPR